jgi:hypothetical protein
VQAPIRCADLWLTSNIPQIASYFLPVGRGIAFHDQRVSTSDPERHWALLGMRPLIRAGVKLDVDFASRTFSLCTL